MRSRWKPTSRSIVAIVIAIHGLLVFVSASAQDEGSLITIGSMHEAIGEGKHQGRLRLREITAHPGFFGVGALQQLQGEITVFDSVVFVTSVDPEQKLKSLNVADEDLQATLFVGGSVLEWQESLIRETVPAMRLDQFIQLEAERAEISTSVPFLVVIEGDFTNAKLHVINGACPVHARRNKKSLAPEVKPYEEDFDSVPGRLVGIFALNAAGKLTHPGTSLHAHLIWKHENGQQFTGHLEQTGVKEGSRMKIARRLAKVSLPAAQSEPSSK